MDLVNNRHPRTCLCETKESVIFITIDGRNKEAEGMNLFEVQNFLLNIGCVDAINLDGGGSTTMWTKEKGIINFPSDSSGERPVSNTLLIIPN
jgi:exopolysaccharide biosynthesis protein